MRTPLIEEKISFLRSSLDIERFHDPNLGPAGPVFRTAIADYIVAEILRDIGGSLRDQQLATKLHNIGKELASEASRGLVAGWDDGDDICPPWLWHFKKPGPPNPPDPDRFIYLQILEPDPSPWKEQTAMNDVFLAFAIRQLASLTTNEKASAAMKEVGETIVKSASAKLFDEYCGTPVKPRVPAPRPKGIAA